MKVAEIIAALELFAPPAYQESYDNSGLQVGDKNAEVTGVLLTLDITEAVLAEALHRGCNLIVSHHPIIFSGLKRLTGQDYVARIVQEAIKKDLVLYSIHTNLDNARGGVNKVIADKLGLQDTTVLKMLSGTLRKLYTFAPLAAAGKVREALFSAGAGDIGRYSECSFNTPGTGTFKPDEHAAPKIGEAGGPREYVDEIKIEVLVQKHKEAAVLKALFESHPYEEVAYEFVHLHNYNQELGAGMIGTLPGPMDADAFLRFLKEKMNTACIRHTALPAGKVERIAVCGGAGQSLLPDAIRSKADVFITSDFKYHQFFDADGHILIADIGHWESEQYTVELLCAIITKKFPNFAPLISTTITNPVNYFF